ncbi:MAG: lysozyme inhibitor LprI family protein [Hyphomicrobiaceae bacterium]
MRTALFVVATMLAAYSLASPASAASFNCREPGNRAETTVCRHPGLSAMDERMAYWYGRAQERARHFGQSEWLRNRQRDWIADRNICGFNVGCLRQSYRERTRALRNFARHV